MVADPPSHPTAANTNDASAANDSSTSIAAAVPLIDLGPSFEAIAFVPGRYALAIQASRTGGHARHRVRESSTMSLVLDFADDRTVTACRGWDYALANDGPSAQTEDVFREQKGFRGSFEIREGVLYMDLAADDNVCAPIAEYSKGTPRRSSSMKLRCVLARPRSGVTLPAPSLLCEWQDATTPEVAALRTGEVAPRPWFALGSGNGLRIKVTGALPGTTGDATKVVSEPAPTPIGADAWQHPF
jgi:hypothetical protein